MSSQGPKIVDKPWGHEEVFAATERYVGKILFIRGGQALSLQFHERKDETIRMLEGMMRLLAGPAVDRLETHELGPGDTYHIPPGTIHRMLAEEDSLVLEVSTPELDDVVRLEDRYGREGTNAP